MTTERSHRGGGGQAELVDALQGATRTLVGVAVRSLARVPGLSLQQVRLLLAVRESGPSSGLELARAIDLSPASVSRHAERLVQAGHLERVISPENRRVVAFHLTASGHAVVDHVEADRGRAFTLLIEGLGDGEAAQVAASLRAMAAAAEPHVG